MTQDTKAAYADLERRSLGFSRRVFAEDSKVTMRAIVELQECVRNLAQWDYQPRDRARAVAQAGTELLDTIRRNTSVDERCSAAGDAYLQEQRVGLVARREVLNATFREAVEAVAASVDAANDPKRACLVDPKAEGCVRTLTAKVRHAAVNLVTDGANARARTKREEAAALVDAASVADSARRRLTTVTERHERQKLLAAARRLDEVALERTEACVAARLSEVEAVLAQQRAALRELARRVEALAPAVSDEGESSSKRCRWEAAVVARAEALRKEVERLSAG